MKTWKQVELEEKLAGLRKKWVEARKKKGDFIMAGVYDRMAKALKIRGS